MVEPNSFTPSSLEGSSLKTASEFQNSGVVGETSSNEAPCLPPCPDARVNEAVNCNYNAIVSAADITLDFSSDSFDLNVAPAMSAASQDLCYSDTRRTSTVCNFPTEQSSDEGFDSQNGGNSWDMDRGDCINSTISKDDECRSYFKAVLQVDADTKQRSKCLISSSFYHDVARVTSLCRINSRMIILSCSMFHSCSCSHCVMFSGIDVDWSRVCEDLGVSLAMQCY